MNRIIEENLKAKFIAFARADSCTDESMVALMKEAGVRTLVIGFESINQETLKI
jgi:radical SAM superfamily enzyme YgiQ (UPF0313 family)